MKQWVAEQLAWQLESPAGVVVLLDPDEALDEADVADISEHIEVARAVSWAELRRLWDIEVRAAPAPRHLAVIVCDPEMPFVQDLPWDIEHDADVTLRMRWPVPQKLRRMLRLAGEGADALVAASRRHPHTEAAIADAYDFRVGDATSELDAVARLRLDAGTPQEVWIAVASIVATPLAKQIASASGAIEPLQTAWSEWLALGDAAEHAAALRGSPRAVLALLGAGLLGPSPATADGLPNWVSVGTSDPDPELVITELLAGQPAQARTLSEWIEVASWWGHVRGTLASNPTIDNREHAAWVAWDAVDAAFGSWLQSSYGASLLSAAITPRSVHQIAPFLSRRVDEGASVLLIVIDGLAFAQWHRLRMLAGLRVLESTACLAMIPTLTSISRQAIFAGDLPAAFEDTIGTTSAEERRWKAFWVEHGINDRLVKFSKTVGRDTKDVPTLSGRVEAVIINAVDELLHAAEVLGDPQVAGGVELWARTGFLRELVTQATSKGYETWVTADHGNLPTLPGPVPREGDTVESAGTRVRLYPNETLRAGASDYGDVWDPPVLPISWLKPLFAPGRRGFHVSGVRVSHGGLSIDEVIVPFARVTV